MALSLSFCGDSRFVPVGLSGLEWADCECGRANVWYYTVTYSSTYFSEPKIGTFLCCSYSCTRVFALFISDHSY